MSTMTRQNALRILVPLVLLGACSAGRQNATPALTGTATAAVTLAPASVACLQIQVSGASTVTRQFDLVPQENTTFYLGDLPIGQDTFSATAFGVTCADAGSSSPTWLSNSVTATVVPSPPVQVTLDMYPAQDGGFEAGGGLVAVNFPGPSLPCGPVINELAVPSAASYPTGITAGPDGNPYGRRGLYPRVRHPHRGQRAGRHHGGT
jgi:hypothetical protein